MITGGAGFIGSSLVRLLSEKSEEAFVVVDKLSYAGNLESLPNDFFSDPRGSFERIDICDKNALRAVFHRHKPKKIIHLAAESHVDRSISGPAEFISTNVVGTFNMLEVAREYYDHLTPSEQKNFLFLHVSTDEVFGDLAETKELFLESTPYAPSSPYSASKAASDHLARAWHRTYGLPVLVTNCSNNYGPNQFPEKLIPTIILNCIQSRVLPVYGDGLQVRDWLYVDDHTRALLRILENGVAGESYNIGGNNQKSNITVVETVCDLVDEFLPDSQKKNESSRLLIRFVDDRPGHDRKYAINAKKIESELGWRPIETFESGLKKTVLWYLHNASWWQRVVSGEYLLTNDRGSF